MDAAAARSLLAGYDARRYFRYAELVELLHACAAAYPHLCRLEPIGQSAGGRVIWSATVTCFATGPDADKPGFQIVANHHAAELTTSSVALYTLKYLLEQYGQDPDVTRLLETRAVYILPRLTVDGSEHVWDSGMWLRSSPVMWPFAEEQEGFAPADVDGDGRVLTMRVPDPLGEWRASARDPRLLVRRRPDDRDGPFYRVLPEGYLRERGPGGLVPARPVTATAAAGPPGTAAAATGVAEPATAPPGETAGVAGAAPGPAGYRSLAGAPGARALDFNRQYPANWEPHHRQYGAGPYPFSQPETRALAAFYLAHPNLCAALSHHTYSGVLLRPPCIYADDKLPPADLSAFRFLGELATETTGMPCVSVYADFQTTAQRDRMDVGTWLEWAYDHLGLLAFETELWAWPYVTGVARRPLKEWPGLSDQQREEDGLKALQWVDRENGGEGFHPWRRVDHPQLGPVEVGGWDALWLQYNPPARLLPDECRRWTLFTVRHALATPLLRLGEVAVLPAGGGVYRVAARVENQGVLPTGATAMAERMKAFRPGLRVTLELPDGARLLTGPATREPGELEGTLGAGAAGWASARAAHNFCWVEWAVQAAPGTALTVRASHPRAGAVAGEVVLP